MQRVPITNTTGQAHELLDSSTISSTILLILGQRKNGTHLGGWQMGGLSLVSISCIISPTSPCSSSDNTKMSCASTKISIGPSSQEKTAFATHDWLYEFKVTFLGVCKGPPMIQCLMQQTLRGVGEYCSVYIEGSQIVPWSSGLLPPVCAKL